MELVQRYVAAVKGYLPAEGREDIALELTDNLLSRIEAREINMVRKLNDEEVGAILKEMGHPMLVAGRYLPQQQLFGPALFPFWWHTLRMVLFALAAVYGVLTLIELGSSGNPIKAAIQGGVGFAERAVFAVGAVTLLFWALDHYQVKIGFLQEWRPDQLARVADKTRISPSDPITDLVFSVLFLMWWTNVINWPATIRQAGEGFDVVLTAPWQPYFWPVIALFVADIVLAAYHLWKPYWAASHLLFRAGCNVISLAILYQLYTVTSLVVLAQGPVENAEINRVVGHINQAVHWALLVVAAIAACEIWGDMAKLVKSGKGGTGESQASV